MTVPAVFAWKTNGDLIADVAKLGYLDGMVLDPTYGRGLWWTKFRPADLVWSDINPLPGTDAFPFDFTDLPWREPTFDAVAFDPPYVAMGGRKTTGLPEFFDRFGLTDAPKTPRLLQDVIDAGLDECVRVLKPRGYLLVKCKDYISSGSYWPGTFYTALTAIDLGLVIVDRFDMLGTSRPQPAGRRQVHAHGRPSTLLVFRKGRA